MPLQVKVIIPGGVLLDTTADTVVVPGSQGDFQVFPGHLPLFTALQPGLLFLDEKGKRRVAVFGGVAEVLDDQVTLLAENAEIGEKVDVERAMRARERAQQRLEKAQRDENIDINRARAALRRALLRLQATGTKIE